MKPVDTVQFWQQRIYAALASGRGIHTAIYDTDPDTWQRIQNDCQGLLARYVTSGTTLLDAGCGYGALYDVLPAGGWAQRGYCGLDMSPDLLALAQLRHPSAQFVLGDIANMAQFRAGQFDLAVTRSIRDMIVDELGKAQWESMQRELLRVAKRLLIIEYTEPRPPISYTLLAS